ncbi:MAG: ATP-dependent DNA helicase RecG [Gammaproteobacteria bacterium]
MQRSQNKSTFDHVMTEPRSKNPITTLKGVGPRIAERLEKIGIKEVQDLLFHLPLRYQDRTRIMPIGAALHGSQVAVQGEIELSQVKFGRRRSLLCRISDGTGALTLRFFHFSAAQQKNLSKGLRIICFGEIRNGSSTLEMVHPEYRVVGEDEEILQMEDSLTPIYPTTEGLHQISLRKLTEQALSVLASDQNNLLEDFLLQLDHKLLNEWTLSEAIQFVHRPPPEADVNQLITGQHSAQKRLVFEELLAHQLSKKLSRKEFKDQKAPCLKTDGKLTEAFLTLLPFDPTSAQQRVVKEIQNDLIKNQPMSRLVQGDVGSGKTLVAAIAALQAIEAGFQVALMAPTELLAEQHLRTFQQWFEPLKIPIIWISGKLKAAEKRQALLDISATDKCVVIGTHALFQQSVEFKKLGLSIVDEQHRFGVHQRLALREKGNVDGNTAHQLIMTATPIPRTLAMTAYADLDVSVIDELPAGRQPVTTTVIPELRREEIIDRITDVCRQGRQVYWVCTLIEESETLQCQTATETADLLVESLAGLKVGLIHGRLDKDQKNNVMQAFHSGEIDLLVATTVIEVGVDVPNASLMIIENAERLGLAQLHQLRGRVGRGSRKSDCVLMYHSPLSDHGKARLAIMRETNDGFKISQKDLELRGPGEFLGTRQAGSMRFIIADLMRDQDLVPDIEKMAIKIMKTNSEIIEPLIQRWMIYGIDYADV